MNSILIIIVAVIVLLLVFVMFSLDDHEDELEDFLPEETVPENVEADHAAGQKAGSATPLTATPLPRSAVQGSASAAGGPGGPLPESRVDEVGEEGDLRFRVLLEDFLPLPTGVNLGQAVVACIQLRFGDEALARVDNFHQILEKAETIVQAEHSPFPGREYPGSQLSRFWLFALDEHRDDCLFEAMVNADDVVSRFRKALEKDDALREAKASIAIGMAKGDVTQIQRGPIGMPTFVGCTMFLAETLAEAAGDFQIYVDAEVHRHAQPLFDFREWKPVKLRSPLPPVPYFEMVGWNKKEEIFAGAASEDATVRRAVAVAYRYLEFNDLGPLLGLLSDADERVAMETLKTLAELGDERALGILKKILPEAQNNQLRSAIIQALGSLGKEEVMPVLLAATKDVNWQVRYRAAQALHKICGPDAIKHLEHLGNDEDGAVRCCFHRIMFEQTKDEQHLEILQSLMTDLSHRARKAAVESLVEIGTERALFALVNRFREQEPELRRYLLRLLAGCRSPVLYACFLKLFQIADKRSRPDIVTAVRRAQIVS